MSGGFQQSSNNELIKINKRSWSEEYNKPTHHKHRHKKLKQNMIEVGSKSDFDIVTIIKSELELILSKINNFNTIIEDIQPYGSRISGIFTDDSDVDFNINCTSKMPLKTVIKLIAKSLRKNSTFTKIVTITNAKIPIIKCIHTFTGIDTDLSFNNISAVHNTNLLNYIINMDQQIKSVLTKLKMWAKKIGLINTNGFSSYSFYWLGLFCMQVMGILPAIHNLQNSVPECIIECWNFAFSKNQQEFIKKKQTNLSENDILNVIYAYYSSFDFEKFVISPYSGCPLLKKDFENVDQLPEELWRYKQFYTKNKEQQKLLFLGTSKFNMYVQDPFQHNRNITARVTPKVFDKFVKACVKHKKNQ